MFSRLREREWRAPSEARTGYASHSRATIDAPAVERAVDHVHLLLARQPHEVHRIARDPDRQADTSPGWSIASSSISRFSTFTFM